MEGSPLVVSTGNSTLDAIALESGAAGPDRIVEWAVLFGVAVLFTTLRTYARARISGWRRLSWDDALVWVAVIAFAVLIVDVYIISVTAEGLSNDGLSEDRRAALAADLGSEEVRLRGLGSKAQVAKWLLYGLVLWLLKGSLLHFFAGRLTGGIPGARSRAWSSALILLVTYGGTVAAVFLGCMPFKNYWQIFPNPGKMCLPAISPVLIGVFLSCNIFTDLYLVSMPIPVLVRAPLRKVQKLSLIFLFGCNVLVTGMAILRAVLLLKDPWINGDGMWAVREAFVAICTTNMPPVVPLLRVWLSPCLGRTESVSDDADADAADGSRTTKGLSKMYSNATKRSASRASRKSHMQMLHNRTMTDRYFADLEAPAPPKSSASAVPAGTVDIGGNEIKMQTYATSGGGDTSTIGRAVDMPPQAGTEKSSSSMATTGQKQDVDENVVQTAREMV